MSIIWQNKLQQFQRTSLSQHRLTDRTDLDLFGGDFVPIDISKPSMILDVTGTALYQHRPTQGHCQFFTKNSVVCGLVSKYTLYAHCFYLVYFVYVWTFVMHSRSVLCMTGHYNFYYVCIYVGLCICLAYNRKSKIHFCLLHSSVVFISVSYIIFSWAQTNHGIVILWLHMSASAAAIEITRYSIVNPLKGRDVNWLHSNS